MGVKTVKRKTVRKTSTTLRRKSLRRKGSHKIRNRKNIKHRVSKKITSRSKSIRKNKIIKKKLSHKKQTKKRKLVKGGGNMPGAPIKTQRESKSLLYLRDLISSDSVSNKTIAQQLMLYLLSDIEDIRRLDLSINKQKVLIQLFNDKLNTFTSKEEKLNFLNSLIDYFQNPLNKSSEHLKYMVEYLEDFDDSQAIELTDEQKEIVSDLIIGDHIYPQQTKISMKLGEIYA